MGIHGSMKRAVLLGMLLLPVLQAQQVNSPTVLRPTVAVAPNAAGANAGGGAGAATGGISFVTRPGTRATTVLAGAAFFNAAGVPVLQGGAPGGVGGTPASLTVATSPPSPPPASTLNTLTALAAGGNREARQALVVLRALETRSPVTSGR